MTDPIVEEIHKIREEYAAKFDYDVDAMFEDLHKKQSESNRKIVSFAKNDDLKKNDKDKSGVMRSLDDIRPMFENNVRFLEQFR